MTRQEEIREHSEEIVSDCVYGLAKAPMSSEDIIKELFTYLHSQRCRIEVTDQHDLIYILKNDCAIVAVEPLIREVSNG